MYAVVSTHKKRTGADMDVLPQMDEIRAQMLSALASDFNLSEEDAMEIITYSPLDYSDRIQSIINGTEFVPRGQAIAEEYGISYGENGLGLGGENAMGTDASEEVPGNNSSEEGSTDMPDLLPEEKEKIIVFFIILNKVIKQATFNNIYITSCIDLLKS